MLWRQTSHSYRISTEGRNRPAPSIGSPTLIWHLGVWRKRNHARGYGEAKPHDFYINDYERHNALFYEEIFDFLRTLQQRGLARGSQVNLTKLEPIAIEGIANDGNNVPAIPRRFKVFTPQSASFTLWWRDSAKDGVLNTPVRETDDDVDQALRVFVQFQSFQDHVTVTFYIDGAKLFKGHQIHKREEIKDARILGERRTRLADHLDTIRRCSYEQIISDAVDLESSHHAGDPEVAKDLKTAADYLFEDVWSEFQSAFGFTTRPLEAVAPGDGSPFLDQGLIFVNQRGLMMSIRGLDTEDDKERAALVDDLARRNNIAVQYEQTAQDKPWRQHERSASATLGPVEVFNAKCGEPETVLKSLWPFLCQMTEQAARKDWVGCGILDWRALFMSTLGSRAQPHRPDGAGNVPAYRLTLAPERFFIVTKGEPHRHQIGRFVERLLSLETTRAIAFKNLGTIQNASLQLRTLTMALDDILEQWAVERKAIQEPWDKERIKRHTVRKRGDVLIPPSPDYIIAEKRFYDELSALNAEYETQLIDIAASLERMGPGGSGHLAHSIDEASYHIGEFDRMVPTLEIGNVAGWINYAQFADRGMRPTFNMIKNTGQRLIAAQDRLKTLTDVVQVSALIVQSDATRRNTDTLREIASNVQLLNSPQLLIRGYLGACLFTVLVVAVYYAGVMKVLDTGFHWVLPYLHWW